MNSIKEAIINTHLFNLVTARLHQRKRRKELYQLCKPILNQYANMPTEGTGEVSNYIWICWWQGENDMPPVVRECYRRIKTFNADKNVVLISENNLNDYVSFPQYIMDKYSAGIITKTHFSDLLRTELLLEYGGIWMDATLFTFGGVPERFYDFPIYTGRYPYNKRDYNVSKNRWTSYFLVSRRSGNIMFQYLSDFWRQYWSKYDDLIEYLLVDFAFDFGYRYVPQIKQELDLVPENGCGENVWILLNNLSMPYDAQYIDEIGQKNWMQKLSFRVEADVLKKALDPQNSIYSKLFLDVGEEHGE